MAIAYFPDIYEDELLYSVMARYFEQSGYVTFSTFAEDFLHYNKAANNQYIENLQKPLIEFLQEKYTMETLINDHTMFNWDARFLPETNKKDGFEQIIKCDVGYIESLSLAKRNHIKGSKIKYCPCCVREDRESVGEAYYHRIHQIVGVEYCVKHKCKLYNTTLTLGNTTNYDMRSCEQEAVSMEEIYDAKEIQLKFEEYCISIFLLPLSLSRQVNIYDLIYESIKERGYMSSKEGLVYSEQIAVGMNAFYESIYDKKYSPYQMYKLIRNEIWKSFDICKLLYFFDVKIEALGQPTKIKRIRKTMKKEDDWEILDAKSAPQVKGIVEAIQAKAGDRPIAILPKIICTNIGIKEPQLKFLPKTSKEIELYSVSYQEAKIKRIYWAYEKLKASDESMAFRNFRKLMKIDSKVAEELYPLLEKGEAKDYIFKVISNRKTNDKVILRESSSR